MSYFKAIMHQIWFQRPCCRSLQCSPRLLGHLPGFKGTYSKGREGRKIGREGQGRGERRKAKGTGVARKDLRAFPQFQSCHYTADHSAQRQVEVTNNLDKSHCLWTSLLSSRLLTVCWQLFRHLYQEWHQQGVMESAVSAVLHLLKYEP